MPRSKTASTRSDVSVIGNRLDAISKEIGQTMLRTSRSPIFSEARDFVTAIFDGEHRLVAQTAYIPVLMGRPCPTRCAPSPRPSRATSSPVTCSSSMIPTAATTIRRTLPLPSRCSMRGELCFWSVAKGHHADVGGGGVAGYNPARPAHLR
jgi:N-methylhydantoinase B